MKKIQTGLLDLKNKVSQAFNKLRAEITRRLRIIKSDLDMHFWNFKIRLPNIALTAPLIGAIIILVAGVFFLVVGFRILHPSQPMTFYTLLPDFYSNASTTLIGIAFTVLIIDGLNRIRDDRLEKIRLLRDIGCGDHGIALRAVQDITAKNLQQKGFLCYRIFENAQLAGAMLVGADLSHSSFHHSDFTGVELFGGKLQMTSFWGGSLRGDD